jgi:electron transfer flavoprotein alpha subunit
MSIFVWVDQFRGKALPVSWEALAVGRQLADKAGVKLTAVIFGQGLDTLATLALHYGADRVVKCDDAVMVDYRLEPYAATLAKAVKDGGASTVLIGGSTRGRELAAAISADLDAALLADVTELAAENGKLIAVRPVYAGKVLSNAETTGAPLTIVTTRSRAFSQLAPDSSRTGEVSMVAPALGESEITSKVESFEETKGTVNLADAGIIISGGRGVGGPEGFAPVRELADVLGGAVGASRAAVDAGWIPYPHQVGQTGKVVSPNLYIAAGLSGSIQHQAGMRTSKVIVAINKDADAPIFKLARYGIVGDLFKEMPVIAQVFREKMGK